MEMVKKLINVLVLMSCSVLMVNVRAAQDNANGEEAKEAAVADHGLEEALLKAVQQGDEQRVRIMLAQNVPIDGSVYAMTPLQVACYYGHSALVALLLQAGAEVDVKSQEQLTPLMYAAISGYGDITRMLIEAKASLNVQNEDGFTALMLAIQNSHIDVVQVLLEGGARIDISDNAGISPSMMAVEKGNIDILRLLFKYAVLKSVDNDAIIDVMYGALLMAAWKGNLDMVTLILYEGLPINSTLALRRAVEQGHKSVVNMLIQAGVSPIEKDLDDGLSAWDIATDDMKQVIEQAGQEQAFSGLMSVIVAGGDSEEVGQSWAHVPAGVREIAADYVVAPFSFLDRERREREAQLLEFVDDQDDETFYAQGDEAPEAMAVRETSFVEATEAKEEDDDANTTAAKDNKERKK